MMICKKRYVTRSLILATSIFITSCSLSISNETPEVSNETLASLVNESTTSKQGKPDSNLKIQLLTRQQRTDKLVKIYRSILTLEPNRQVRAQIQHRMVQLDIEKYEKNETLENNEVLAQLVNKYQDLLSTYPNRPENEDIQYQLAKTYDLLGKAKASILTLESLLDNYPNTKHYAELHFRLAELYYNLQQYPLAYKAYQAVLAANNNEYYRLNSLYMSGWSLFKLNRLPAADKNFIAVLNQIAKVNSPKTVETKKRWSHSGFAHVSASHKSLAADTQRVLSISLSQQQQAKSLVELLNQQQPLQKNRLAFEHVLFKNLADFLVEKGLEHDAILTYQAYLDYAPNTLWAAKFSLVLIDLYKQKNQFSKVKTIKDRFVDYYGLTSHFWQQANENDRGYVLPYLSEFSLVKSRQLYAHAQELEGDKERIYAFGKTVLWLKKYLNLVEYSNKQITQQNLEVTEKPNLATQEYFLYADANFEAKQYEKALNIYKMLAYSPLYFKQQQVHANEINDSERLPSDVLSLDHIRKESAYASIVTMNELLTPFTLNANQENKKAQMFNENHQQLLLDRQQLTDLFIEHYHDDKRATLVAVKSAEYAFEHNNIDDVIRYSNFVLNAYKVTSSLIDQSKNKLKSLATKLQKHNIPKLDNIALKQVAIVSQLKANIRYQFKQYSQSEQDYLLALNFVHEENKKQALNELVASSIYEQAKSDKALATELTNESAIKHYLRLGQLVPQSKYRANAEFDAANLLLAGKKWSRAIGVLSQFKQQFPLHQYVSTIPAKLAFCYENLGDWSQAAKQLLVIVGNEQDVELKRESQYTAAEYYLKAGDLSNALINFRTYAHQYPEPFAIAQEVRFKMSEFYRKTKEPNKRYYWYRKIIKYHQDQVKISGENLERSTYLTSYAAFNLGQAHQQTFNNIKLKVPLNKSLQRKQAAMKKAIHYYQLVFQEQLAEFVPQANYSIGQIYLNLAKDVMKSERPEDLDELALEEYEFVLEEIAYPFEEKAIEIHQANAERAWDNIFDKWVKQSLAVLAELEPAKYNKYETVPEVFDATF
jgi:tetratricopeptide (TPR) repeat protein